MSTFCPSCSKIPFFYLLPGQDIQKPNQWSSTAPCRWRKPSGEYIHGKMYHETALSERNHYRYPLGSVEDVVRRATQCALCSLVRQVLDLDYKYITSIIKGDYGSLACILNLMDSYGSSSTLDPYGFRISRYWVKCLQVCIQWGDKMEYQEYIEIARMPHVIQASLSDKEDRRSFSDSESQCTLLRRPRGVRFDATLLQSWLQFCDETHGADCHPCKAQQIQTLRLIDVHQRCLIDVAPPSGFPRYLTLSYLWGIGVQKLVLMSSRLEELYSPGAITGLSRSIEDAMDIVKHAGERYLWVDALCIIQDDPNDQSIWIPQMSAIYGCSVLTLAAVDGEHADAGLPGVSADRPRSPTAPLEEFALTITSGPQLDADSLINSIWRQRGWTFQEELLSTRLLYIGRDGIHWKCPQTEWFEDLDAEGNNAVVSRPIYDRKPYLSLSGMEFGEIVADYTHRTLTFSSDRHRAFAGILASLPEQYFWGIPEASFERNLQWAFDRGESTLTPPPSRNGLTAPSWSWIAWQGPVQISRDLAAPKFICYRWDDTVSDLVRLSTGTDTIYSLNDRNPAWNLEGQASQIPAEVKLRDDHIVFWAEVVSLPFFPADWHIEGVPEQDFRLVTETLKVLSLSPIDRKSPAGADAGFFLKECIILYYDAGMDDVEGMWPPVAQMACEPSYRVMIISFVDGVAYRDDVVTIEGYEWDPKSWKSWKLMIMG